MGVTFSFDDSGNSNYSSNDSATITGASDNGRTTQTHSGNVSSIGSNRFHFSYDDSGSYSVAKSHALVSGVETDTENTAVTAGFLWSDDGSNNASVETDTLYLRNAGGTAQGAFTRLQTDFETQTFFENGMYHETIGNAIVGGAFEVENQSRATLSHQDAASYTTNDGRVVLNDAATYTRDSSTTGVFLREERAVAYHHYSETQGFTQDYGYGGTVNGTLIRDEKRSAAIRNWDVGNYTVDNTYLSSDAVDLDASDISTTGSYYRSELTLLQSDYDESGSFSSPTFGAYVHGSNGWLRGFGPYGGYWYGYGWPYAGYGWGWYGWDWWGWYGYGWPYWWYGYGGGGSSSAGTSGNCDFYLEKDNLTKRKDIGTYEDRTSTVVLDGKIAASARDQDVTCSFNRDNQFDYDFDYDETVSSTFSSSYTASGGGSSYDGDQHATLHEHGSYGFDWADVGDYTIDHLLGQVGSLTAEQTDIERTGTFSRNESAHYDFFHDHSGDYNSSASYSSSYGAWNGGSNWSFDNHNDGEYDFDYVDVAGYEQLISRTRLNNNVQETKKTEMPGGAFVIDERMDYNSSYGWDGSSSHSSGWSNSWSNSYGSGNSSANADWQSSWDNDQNGSYSFSYLDAGGYNVEDTRTNTNGALERDIDATIAGLFIRDEIRWNSHHYQYSGSYSGDNNYSSSGPSSSYSGGGSSSWSSGGESANDYSESYFDAGTYSVENVADETDTSITGVFVRSDEQSSSFDYSHSYSSNGSSNWSNKFGQRFLQRLERSQVDQQRIE